MKATQVAAGLAESNGSLLAGLWHDSLHVTCGLTACTPGYAPGPTLGNEYGKTLAFTFYCSAGDIRAGGRAQVDRALLGVLGDQLERDGLHRHSLLRRLRTAAIHQHRQSVPRCFLC